MTLGSLPPPAVGHAPTLVRPLIPPDAVTQADVRRGRAQVRMVCALLLAIVLLQRLVLPLGGGSNVPLLLLLAFGVAVAGLAAGLLSLDFGRAALVLLALGICATSGVLALAVGRPDTSVLSVVYLVLTYLPFLLVLDRPPRWVVDRCLRFFTSLATVVGAAAIIQVVLQPLGVAYTDAVASVVPSALLAEGFNTSYPIVYNSTLYKANAWVFLEPSFCSQFLGLAFVVLLAQGRRGWRLAVIAGGIVCTVAGTGMAVVAIGGGVLLLRRGIGAVRPLLVPLLITLTVAAFTPVGTVLLSRVTETGQSDSSGSLRFVQPFQVIGGAWLSNVSTALLGAGPGASERLAVRVAGSTALQQPAPLKLLYDYGAVAAVVFLVCMLWVFVAGAPVPGLTAALVTTWVILNSALLLPVVVVLLWTFTSLMSSASPAASLSGMRSLTGREPLSLNSYG